MVEQTVSYKDTKFRGMRKRIAEKMALSSRETASFTQCRRADVTEFLKLRDQKKIEYSEKDIKVPSINDMVLKATALALRDHTDLNSTFQDNMIRTYDDININMAVTLPNGLITPVIPNVDKLSVWDIAKLTIEAAEKARNGALTVEDVMGGTFTVTNVGMVKVEMATPIINHPQVGILAFGTIVPELQRVDGEIVDRLKMFLNLTVDHRIIDGYPAAVFLNSVCDILENPIQLWEK
jgi:pyruvate dehydrogenase E2 component (dihydrolipoamide acetyltransferase)